MENILIDELPKTVTVDGEEYPIEWNFRAAILFELLMDDPDYSAPEKIEQALLLFYPKEIPVNIDTAVDEVIKFYLCGEDLSKEQETGGWRRKRSRKNYSFEQDAAYIYAAFLSEYGIDLNSVEGLHWWKFSALFSALGENHKISQIMYYRDVSLKGKSGSEKKFLTEMKRKYALKETVDVCQKMSLAQRDSKMAEYVKRRHLETGGE